MLGGAQMIYPVYCFSTRSRAASAKQYLLTTRRISPYMAKEQKERSYPESNRGRPDVLHHDVVSIRTGSDNRYTIEPFLVHRVELT